MYTPLEIESIQFKKRMWGYSIKEVDKFMEKVLNDYEKLYKETIEHKDKISLLNEGIQYYKSMEDTLKNTMVIAEKTAQDVKQAAHEKAEQIQITAENSANKMLFQTREKIAEMEQKMEILRSQHESAKIQLRKYYQSQLELLDQNFFTVDTPIDTNEIKIEDTIKDKVDNNEN